MRTFKKYSKYPIMSLYIYFCTNYYMDQITTLRFGISLCFFWISLEYLLKNQNKKYLFFIFIASLFHISSIVLFILPFILKVRKIERWLIVFGIIFILFRTPIFLFLIQFSSKLKGYYMEDKVNINFLILLENILIYIGSKILLNKGKDKNRLFLNLKIIEIYFLILSFDMYFLTRIKNFFSISTYILVPEIYYQSKKKTKVLLIIIFYFLIRFIVVCLKTDYCNYTNYLINF